MVGNLNGRTVKLGNAGWCGVAVPGQGLYTGLTIEGSDPASFRFEDELRPDAKATIAQLQTAGLAVQILSGDHKAAVEQVAGQLHIETAIAGLTPAQKIARIQALQTEGHRVLMVGDGLNDGPALAAGHVAMAPASAADVGRAAAGFVFLHDSLSAVTTARDISARALRLVHQNFGLAVAYNLVAVPLAVLGYATPLVAAIAMSSSSILVVANALRLRLPAKSLLLTLPRRKPADAFALSPGLPLETRS